MAVCKTFGSRFFCPDISYFCMLSIITLSFRQTTCQHSSYSEEAAVGTWNVTESNVTCILLKSAITLKVNYNDSNNKTVTSVLNIPLSAQPSGSCMDQHQHIILSWQQPTNSTRHQGLNNSLTFDFYANETNKNGSSADVKGVPLGKFAIVKVEATIQKYPDWFPNVTYPSKPFFLSEDGLLVMPTSLNHSFACNSAVTIGSADKQVQIVLESSQIEAFKRGSPSTGYNVAEHCSADEVSSGSVIGTVIVSILIIILLALGVAALTTYYLKKRRAASSAYETM